MIYLAISIFLFNILVILFKLFEKYNINNLQALLVNYIVSTLLAFYFIEDTINIKNIIESEWIYHSIFIGILFISIFNIYALCVQKVGITVTSVINKMSFIIPVIASIILYKGESFSLSILIGIVLVLIGIYFSSTNNSSFKFNNKYIWLIAIIFFGQGLVDIILNDSKFYIKKDETMLFFLMLFISASITGLIILSFQYKFRKVSIKLKNLIWGIIFGIPNFYSILYFLKALQSSEFINKTSLILPLNSVGVVVSTTLVGVIIYKEILTRRNVVGILISMLSILVIYYNVI
ncbi:MAG: DMT family transporter [Flavobacteriales bacterium]|jgi:drug/metabolite transporter (DMT)-like permease|nr:DMT family transporter [Flavobacteriales bacterium]